MGFIWDGTPNLPEFQKPPKIFQIAIYLCNTYQTAVKLCAVDTNLKKFSKTKLLIFYSSFRVFTHTSSYVCFKSTKTLSVTIKCSANFKISHNL